MAEEGFDRSKERTNIDIISHVGHGKTTLTAAIATVLAKNGDTVTQPYDTIDNTPEERERGVAISTAHIEYQTGKRHYARVDCLGHVDYARNMITGAAQMDSGILVVSTADDLVLQTREHILLSRDVGVPALAVFLNKANVVDDKELLELAEMEVRDSLSGYDFLGDDVPVIAGSALKALEGGAEYEQKILDLMQTVDDYIPTPERDSDKPFMIPVEDVFSIAGRGTVVTGHVKHDQIKVGKEVKIIDMHETSKTAATGVEMFHKLLDYAEAGNNIGALLHGVAREDVQRGQVLAAPGSVTPHIRFKVEVYILSKDEGGHHTSFFTNYRPQFHFRTTDITDAVNLPEGTEMVMPGDNVEMIVELIAPIAIEDGTRFSIREGERTVGSGVVVEIFE